MKTRSRWKSAILPFLGILTAMGPGFLYFTQFPMKSRSPAGEIPRFAEVSEGIYRGAAPTTDEEFRVLLDHGVRTIIDLRTQREANNHEKEKAEQLGIRFISNPMMGWMFQPSEKSVNSALAALNDNSLKPVFIHCELGRDRTGLVVAMYRFYRGEKNKAEANDEMKLFGFKDVWYLHGLRSYFEEHTNPSLQRDEGWIRLPGE
ncbi:MAG: fused DSP-PTPase phosphatase/NAD kinase-like protein [Bdellovibrionota bacterium]